MGEKHITHGLERDRNRKIKIKEGYSKFSILNIPVPKSDEIIKEIIKKGDVDYTKTKEKIQKLEQEINDCVYELYGLTKKEIAIIEQNL